MKVIATNEFQVHGGNWVRTGVDDFILHRLETEGLKPTPEADRVTLIVRGGYENDSDRAI